MYMRIVLTEAITKEFDRANLNLNMYILLYIIFLYTSLICPPIPALLLHQSLLFATIDRIIIQKKLTAATNAIRKCAGTNRKFIKLAGSHTLQYFLSRPLSLISVTYFFIPSLLGYLYTIALAIL